MSDVSLATEPGEVVKITEMDITITKGKSTVHVKLDDLPDAVYMKALEEGLKVLLNKGMSKITVKDLEGEKLEEAKAAAMVKAEENLTSLYEGKITTRTKKAKTGVPGVVMTEARRIVKAVLKDQAKAAGIKPSHVPAKQWTDAANMVLEGPEGPGFIAMAKKNLEDRAAAKAPEGLNIKSLIHEDPKLAAKANARGKAGEGQLSAKQAGKVKPTTKGAGAQPTAH